MSGAIVERSFSNYWTSTETYEALQRYIDIDFDGVAQDLAAIDDYLRIDELPGGRGFADLAFIPKPGSPLPPMIVELKWNKPADAALAQIEARNYPAALAGLSGECVLAGITYDEATTKHTCAIRRIEL